MADGVVALAAHLDPETSIERTLLSFGPQGCARSVSQAEATHYCHRLARSRYENFPVLSALVPKGMRDGFAAVYAFCRWSDDLADELGIAGPQRQRALRLLGWWRTELDRCFEGTAEHPVFVALRPVIERHGLHAKPFHDLITAFEQDQSQTRYATWDELLGYCKGSADPVGRLVLGLGGFGDGRDARGYDELYEMSDATCTALQLVNFWQDVRRDLEERDRIYLPVDVTGIDDRTLIDWSQSGDDPSVRAKYLESIEPLMDRTEELFERGRGLPRHLGSGLGPVVWAFNAAGRHLCRSIRSMSCATLWGRPTVSKRAKATLLGRAAIGRIYGGALR